ncbi:MAG: tripartite tricarboxylate transporter substrate binding protein [Planctomycetota bacterium]|jgi:tripartite-type tricarboxylate transporter receptor subunit TctC|nr:tripartite tricarboxylate transporter substrate binding protein [Planctomycetota bacterium]
MRRTKKAIAVSTLALVVMFQCSESGARDSWKAPATVTLRAPNAAGGIMDTMLRVLAQGLMESCGQTVVVNNIVGANGALAVNDLLALPASPCEMSGAGIPLFAMMPLLNPDINVNIDDFVIVAGLMNQDVILLVSPEKSGINSFEELMEYGKTNRIVFGSNALGGSTHMLPIALFGEAGIEARAVTSNGSNLDALAVVAGNVICAAVPTSVAQVFIDEGTLKPIAVFSGEPFTGFPGFTVPTVKSYGYDLVFRIYNFLLMKKGVDQAIVDQVHADIQEFYKSEKFKTLAAAAGYTPDTSSGEEILKVVRDGSALCKWIHEKYYSRR